MKSIRKHYLNLYWQILLNIILCRCELAIDVIDSISQLVKLRREFLDLPLKLDLVKFKVLQLILLILCSEYFCILHFK